MGLNPFRLPPFYSVILILFLFRALVSFENLSELLLVGFVEILDSIEICRCSLCFVF